jgi:hypothetical protein
MGSQDEVQQDLMGIWSGVLCVNWHSIGVNWHSTEYRNSIGKDASQG